MKLYSGPLSMFGMKVAIACYEKRLDFDLQMVPFNRDDCYLPKHQEVTRINPKGQVPVLIDGDVELFDSTQIFEYLEDTHPQPALWPESAVERATARQLELLSDEVYFPQVVRLMYVQENLQGKQANEAHSNCTGFYLQMETRLKSRDYLAGDYSYADIAFFMAALFGERMDAPMSEQTPRLLKWREHMVKRKAVVMGIEPLKNHLINAGRAVPAFMTL